jgi:hypothetical protein
MNDGVTTDPSDVLSFAIVPTSIDVSTPANPQIFDPQFGIVNTGATAVSISRALLRVPVHTAGTNLATNLDMAPSASGAWVFSAAEGKDGYAAFELLPKDGVGSIPSGGSVAFMLAGVKVATVVGRAALALQARTSVGSWSTDAFVELTAPSATPTITHYSVTPADPQTLRTCQGQSVVLNWTSTGAAYCTLEDDQGNTWLHLPTSGAQGDRPIVGNATIKYDQTLGRYYERAYTLTAFAAGADGVDQKSTPTIIQLPTIFSFSVSPAAIEKLGDPVTVAWSASGIDPHKGTLTLTLSPADGTGPHPVAIDPSRASGTAILTPTPSTTTTSRRKAATACRPRPSRRTP